MNTKLPGLTREKMPSGNTRYRVRVAGDPYKKVRLKADPTSPEFLDAYRAARMGRPMIRDKPSFIEGSMDWLCDKHMEFLQREVDENRFSAKTMKKRNQIFGKLRKMVGDYPVDMPREMVVRLQDKYRGTPAMANDMLTALKVMFEWGVDRGFCPGNPAKDVRRLQASGTGAQPWTIEDLEKYKEYHRPGSTAFLALTLLAFTACRIGDARLLGRHNEVERDGVKFLEWQPEKKGATFVSIPMAPQLRQAICQTVVVGDTYLLTHRGRAFSTADSMSQAFSKWARQAGLENRTAHGIRKAVGNILAGAGCTQYQIMSIHGHSESRTSEIYTKDVERPQLAAAAMQKMESLEW